MQEIELKLHIPDEALVSVRAALSGLSASAQPAQRLQAAYFDTTDRRLAQARAALRVRQEDDVWVQTLKAAGPNMLTRLEDNRPVPPVQPGQAIRPDLRLYVGTPAGEALQRDLHWDAHLDPQGERTGLIELYRTDMRRYRAHSEVSAKGHDGHATAGVLGTVELALDQGSIAAGALSLPVQELEIELVDGDAQAVIEIALSWVRQHGLRLDTRTKAHRGDRLAREALAGHPCPGAPSRLHTRAEWSQAADLSSTHWAHALDTALEQVTANMSEMASANSAALSPTELLPWIRAWSSGLRRLGWIWCRGPVTLVQTPSGQRLADAIHSQLRTLRPAPGQWAGSAQALTLAQSEHATTLALQMMAVIVRTT